MNRNFTRNQLLALDISQEKNVAVSASAGTGKTTVLVERIFRLLEAKRTRNLFTACKREKSG